MLRYEIWLYATLVATTHTYDLACDIFEKLHKKCPNTDLKIIDTEENRIIKEVNCD